MKIGYNDYLNEIQNIEARVAFTIFRLSNHSLMIGRHQRIDIRAYNTAHFALQK